MLQRKMSGDPGYILTLPLVAMQSRESLKQLRSISLLSLKKWLVWNISGLLLIFYDGQCTWQWWKATPTYHSVLVALLLPEGQVPQGWCHSAWSPDTPYRDACTTPRPPALKMTTHRQSQAMLHRNDGGALLPGPFPQEIRKC